MSHKILIEKLIKAVQLQTCFSSLEMYVLAAAIYFFFFESQRTTMDTDKNSFARTQKGFSLLKISSFDQLYNLYIHITTNLS